MGAKLCKKKRDIKIDQNVPQYDVGHEDDWEDDEMKEVEITPDYKIIVYYHRGYFYAFGNKCPHKGAPLINGVIVDGTLKCSAHGSEFDIESGICEDYPSYEGIPTFQMINVKGSLKVLIKDIGVSSVSRPLGKILSHQRIAVAIGTGASAVAFAQTLREGHWEGRILLISKDNFLPYDKTRLSETFNLSVDNISLKDAEWYTQMDIELKLNTTVTQLDMVKRKLYVDEDPIPINYSKLFIGTGSRGKLPSPRLVQGLDHKNVFTISSISEAHKVYDLCKNKNIAIEGSGFVAMELVSTLREYANMCFIITRQKRPFQVVLGETVGRALQQHVVDRAPNLEFYCFDEIRKINANDKGEIKSVRTLKKREIPCDVVVYAIGSVPNSELFAEDKKALISKSGHIIVSEYCETNVTDVYAGGDVALVPLDCAVTGSATIAQWNFASYTGKIAAARILHVNESIKPYIPFFYTTFCDINFRYTGFGDHYDESIIFGDLFESPKFCVLYRRDRKILACATVNCDQIAARVCFTIGNHYQWEPGVYPKIITDTFLEPPILGEEYFGFRLDRETQIAHYNPQPIAGDPLQPPPVQQGVQKAIDDRRYHRHLSVVGFPPALLPGINKIREKYADK